MKIKFFGKLVSTLGAELEFRVEGPCTIANLRDRIAASYPAAADTLKDRRSKACVGGELASEDRQVEQTETVEFLSPVSGG